MTKYDLRHQHRVGTERFENYMKNSISYRGSTVWNLLEPSAVCARDYAKRAKKSPTLGNLDFSEESPPFFSFYYPANIFYKAS